ncbi:MAG: hypothetical protein HQK79_14480 [Desulfobacterales bacterium]|nr:hypothetical protein [Desulfobacterales bacterium]
MEEDNIYKIQYEFRFINGESKKFELKIDEKLLTLVNNKQLKKPKWTELSYEQCSCCPLNKKEYLYCPTALNILGLVEEFKNMYSYERCLVYCTTVERTYMKETSIQEGLFSVFGLVMATSACPIMKLFRPMARFHLPFSSLEETVVRSTSMYLLRQYFGYKKGEKPDLALKGLNEHYKKVQDVNEGILRRINSLDLKDAEKNAIIILNSFAQILPIEIEEKLESLEYLFTSVSRYEK